MRALWSASGAWRIPALWKFLHSPNYPYVDSEYGKLLCADFASLLQFDSQWEPKLKKIITKQKNGLFVDIGANIGFYSVMALKNGNRVIALEPNVRAFQALSKNAPGAELYPFAAWSEDGTINFLEGRHTDVSHVSAKGQVTPCRRLDTILKGRIPDLVKIDVEGAELEVFQGMPITLNRGKGMKIIFESLDATKLRLASDFLRSFGFMVAPLDRSNYYAWHN